MQRIPILWAVLLFPSQKSMTRFLLFPLLSVIVLPVFAQEEQAQFLPQMPQPVLRDPRLFSQERERITFELQQIQRLIGVIRPDDVQTMDALKAQQAELAKQLRDLTQQMQAEPQPGMPNVPNVPEVLPELDHVPGMRPGTNAVPGVEAVSPPEQRMPAIPGGMQGVPGMQGGNIPILRYQTPIPTAPPITPNPMPNAPMQMYAPTPIAPMSNWADQDRAWESGHWGPRLPRELTEVKQSVESLQREIADLKDTIKALDTQIQLLTRNILLSERVKENGN